MRDPIEDLYSELADGPRNFYDLEDRLIELGHDLGEDPDGALEQLLEETDLLELDDATVLDPHALLDGVTFTVDFSHSHELLDHEVDLALVQLLAERQLPLVVDEEATGVATFDKGYRLHHHRWLPFTEMEVLTGFTVRDGALHVTSQIAEPEMPDDSPLLTLLGEVAENIEQAGVPIEVEPLLLEIVSKGVFAGTLLPISELLERVGLEIENQMVVNQGYDWDAWYDAQAEEFEAEYGDEGGVL
jgi:hypothetical protein